MRFLLVILLACFVVVSGCSKKENPAAQNSQQPTVQNSEQNNAISAELEKIISRRSGWNPVQQQVYGKSAADFSFTDIYGKTHKLSDYKGKNVLIVFWASWCMPCMQEVPHLVALRNIMSEEKLEIIGISNETEELVKRTAADKKMNYIVASVQETLPEPFNKIKAYPSAFFINPDGTIKLATEGGAYLGDLKAIILAE